MQVFSSKASYGSCEGELPGWLVENLKEEVRVEAELTSPIRRRRESKSSRIILAALMFGLWCV
jgi:hypothetical protein